MAFIKNNLQFILILALFAIIFLQRAGDSKPVDAKPIVITVVDSSWKERQQPIINVTPSITNKIPASQGPKGTDTMYLPSPEDSILRIQYKALRDSLLASNIYNQTLKYDSSSITLTDTVHNNKLTGRSYSFHLKYPEVTKTITIKEPYKPVNQVYFGGGLLVTPPILLNGVKAGIIYKNKKDQIYTGEIVQQFSNGTSFSVGMYWKLKLKK